jgi:uncharacterized protein YbjT (DUF2867 family)
MKSVLLAGATGVLGRHVARELEARGYHVRRLVRHFPEPGDWLGDLRRPASLVGALKGIDAVISCAGAAMRLDDWGDRVSFAKVDHRGNRNLLQAASECGVRKFVYVSLACGPELAHTAYAGAHERTASELARSGLRYTIVRPTGFFRFFGEILAMAAKGRGVVVGNGSARTNPIHEAEAARACVDALGSENADMPVGGPEILTRREITEIAFRTLGCEPSIRAVPAWALKPVPALVRIANPRIAALIEFGTAVSQIDLLAPQYGSRRIDDYFRELAALRQYPRWPYPPQDSASSPSSKRTTSATGSSPEKSNTTSSFAGR